MQTPAMMIAASAMPEPLGAPGADAEDDGRDGERQADVEPAGRQFPGEGRAGNGKQGEQQREAGLRAVGRYVYGGASD